MQIEGEDLDDQRRAQIRAEKNRQTNIERQRTADGKAGGEHGDGRRTLQGDRHKAAADRRARPSPGTPDRARDQVSPGRFDALFHKADGIEQQNSGCGKFKGDGRKVHGRAPRQGWESENYPAPLYINQIVRFN